MSNNLTDDAQILSDDPTNQVRPTYLLVLILHIGYPVFLLLLRTPTSIERPETNRSAAGGMGTGVETVNLAN